MLKCGILTCWLLLAMASVAQTFDRIGGANTVDGKVEGDVMLATFDGSMLHVPLMVMFVATSMVAVTAVPTVSIGTNAPNYNDVLPSTSLTGLNVTSETITVPTAKLSHLLGVDGTTLVMRITNDAAGVLYGFNVNVYGTADF